MEKEKNFFIKRVENCLDCDDHVVHGIRTADWFEHEEGCYCQLVKEDRQSGFGVLPGDCKLVGSDDWHLREYSNIPDWCPKLKKKE